MSSTPRSLIVKPFSLSIWQWHTARIGSVIEKPMLKLTGFIQEPLNSELKTKSEDIGIH